ncbi:hypothetical protein [Bosea sp. BH3]|uniref:hypothetical protein n=1 Tax=Bosea sp. BH3 TaxID=2871701 RepID=UPI0021CB38E8|nr:hypothetical protein [Bosea sp. BH3]MCU4178605.1 hypothetical protein [Bosea sp. BH3]
MPFDFPSDPRLMMGPLGALMAGLQANENMNLRSLCRRQNRLCARLQKFDFIGVLEIASGLLTRPENHSATLRIEALIHLAAIHSHGRQKPSLAQVREWLNEILAKDAIGQNEDPVEDVFLTHAPSFRGNIRVFEGAWQDSAHYLTDAVAALLRLRERDWVERTLEEVIALQGLSEAVAEKARVERYATGEVLPHRPVAVAGRTVEAGRAAVEFTISELLTQRLIARDLRPFEFQPEIAEGLIEETLGHTALERRPLVRQGHRLIVALPTAISAAARRHILEAAEAAGDLAELGKALEAVQLQDFMLALRNSGVDLEKEPRPLAPGVTAVVGVFDDGAYVIGLFMADDMSSVLSDGLQSIATLTERLQGPVDALERDLAARKDFRRGLTVLGHGGLGRGFVADFGEPPSGWRRAHMPIGDMLRLSRDHDFTALRIWKILDQEDRLNERDYQLANFNGFLNLYGYLEQTDFNLVPAEMGRPGMVALATDYVAPLRTRVRRALDEHLVQSPDRTRWVEVQRRATDVFFEELRAAPLYVSHLDIVNGVLLGCTETEARPWWIEVGGPRGVGRAHSFIFRIWDAALGWLLRLAPRLERVLPSLSDGPMSIRLEFPDIANWNDQQALADTPQGRPSVHLNDDVIVIRTDAAAMRAYSDATNVAERYLIAAMALGAAQRDGTPKDQAWADALAEEITGSDAARFVHAIPATGPLEMLQATLRLPAPRLVTEEDLAWARLGLAGDVGRSLPGVIPDGEVGALLQTSVLRLWERVRARLQALDRRSVMEHAILNHEAIDKERAEWRQTAAALLALHGDQADVVRANNERESKRAGAGSASRAVAEMALCTSPVEGGLPCSAADLDALLADLVVMLDCAGQCDAYHYGLAAAPLRITQNLSFLFDQGFLHGLHLPYINAHQERAFRDEAGNYGDAFKRLGHGENAPEPLISKTFHAAVLAEYGMGLEDLVGLSFEMAQAAMEAGSPVLWMSRSEVLERLSGSDRDGPVDAEKAFDALTLKPRAKWDEPRPEGARARDWQPWRMDRKLSLIRRPLLQLDNAANPAVLVTPGLLARGVRRIFDAGDGRLPSEMFDSRAMHKWIGTVVDERGHAFNHDVAAALRDNGFETRPDVQLSELGGGKELGDVDVLAWRRETGEVWLVECKRLQLDRTVAEIGERLADYTSRGERGGKRTPIQKHLDRIDYVRAAPAGLSRVTGMPVHTMKIHSALVTDSLVPMQFTARMTHLVDRVVDYRNLGSAFSA